MKLYKITDNLYLRGHTHNLGAGNIHCQLLQLGINQIICLAPSLDVALRNLCTVVQQEGQHIRYAALPFPDGKVVPIEKLRALVYATAMTLDEPGKGTLVHCNAGRNRSALFCALVLICRGWEPRTAIEHIRQVRPGALANPYFVNYILNQAQRDLIYTEETLVC